MADAFVTPALLRWARGRNDLSLGAAADKLGVPVETLAAWEAGERRPTLKQAESLAHKFHVPFACLFLTSPPDERLPIADFRTVGVQPSPALSVDVLDLINDVMAKQDWYRSFLEADGAEELPFLGQFTEDADPVAIAADITRVLSLTDQVRRSAGSWDGFLRDLVRRAEGIGILVLRSGVVGNDTRRPLNVEEFRGFAISDPLAPLVFLNSRDAKAAQVFTLVHELCHLWVGQTGVSNPTLDLATGANEKEALCNAVAAEVLVPMADFVPRWISDVPISDNVQHLATYYRVSSTVVLRRAREAAKITPNEYRETYPQILAAQTPVNGGGGGNYYSNVLARNSTALVKGLLGAVAQGRASYREAAFLLNVRMGTLSRLGTHVYGTAFSLG